MLHRLQKRFTSSVRETMRLYLLVTILVTVMVATCEKIPVIDPGLTECVRKVLVEYDKGRNFVWKGGFEHEEVFETALSTLSDSFIVGDANVHLPEGFRPDFYTFFLSDLAEFDHYVRANAKTMNFDSRARMFAVYLSDGGDIDELFQAAFKHYVINLSVLTKDMKVYTYYPITSASCGENVSKEPIHDCASNATTLDLFPRKLFKQFYGCKIRALCLPLLPYVIDPRHATNPGFEVVLFREVAKRLNLTIELVSHKERRWGTKLGNGHYSDMFGLLEARKGDIFFGMALGNNSVMFDFDFSIFVSTADITVFVPTAKPVESWKNLIIIFDLHVWVGFGVAMVCTVMAWWLIGILKKDDEGYNSFGLCAFKVWCVVFSSFNREPKSALLRSLFVLWSLYAFIMISIYQSVLIGFLTKPAYEKQITTFNELAESKLHVGGFFVVRYIFNEPGNQPFNKIYKRFEFCPLSEECINRTAFQGDFASVKNSRQVNYLVPKFYLDADGQPMLKRLKANIAQVVAVHYFNRGYPFLDRYNEVVLQCHESGLLGKWDAEAQNLKKVVEKSAEVLKPLTVPHLKPAFYVLVIGNGLAFICFLFELQFGRFKLCIVGRKSRNSKKAFE